MSLQYKQVYERYDPETAIRNMEKVLADRDVYRSANATAA
jgi:hypothetical protein